MSSRFIHGAVLLFVLAGSAHGQLTSQSLVYSVASDSGSTSVPTHFHSNSAGIFNQPPGKAEVGRYGPEEVRGLAEFLLDPISATSRRYVSFDVYKAGGLFGLATQEPFWLELNDFPFKGTIVLRAYSADFTESLRAYAAGPAPVLGWFSTEHLTVGDTLSFEITANYDAAVRNGDFALGIRLAAEPLNAAGAWTFDNFRFTEADVTHISAIPEPSTIYWTLAALAALAGARQRQHRRREKIVP